MDPGLYTKPLKLTKPGVTIEAKEMDGNVQISVASGPAITVNFNGGDPVCFKGIKILHTGASDHSVQGIPREATQESASVISETSENGNQAEAWLKKTAHVTADTS